MGHMIRALLPLIVVGGGISLLGAFTYGIWLLGRYYGREETLPLDIADLQARLHRVEQAITQNTAALDRLETAHRISTRLLSGELPEHLERLPARHVTPH